MTIVDWVLIGVLIVFAIAGWHRGFVAGLLSFVGFLGGGLAAAFLLPTVIEAAVGSEIGRIVGVSVGILAGALLGQLLASILGARIRDRITWRPARVVDNVSGMLLNVLALAMVTWIIASALATLPVTTVSQQVAQSRVLGALDAFVPAPARNAFGALQDLIGTTSLPHTFAGLASVTGPDVDAPDPAAVTPAVLASAGSVVKVMGEAPKCDSSVSGSGFVIAPQHVMTNAHVVAGVAEPVVRVRPGDPRLPATVVYFDPEKDIAVLHVEALDAGPLTLATDEAASGDSVIIAGFPQSGSFTATPARVRSVVTGRGEDIYGTAVVDREVYGLRGAVQPGNSGGPLLRPDGQVLGLVFGADEQADTGYALTAAEIVAAISASASLTTAVDTGTCVLRD